MSQIRSVGLVLVVAGDMLPINSFELDETIQGEFSTLKTGSSIAMWKTKGLKPPKKGDSIDLYCGFDGDLDHKFSGVIDNVNFKWGKDTLALSGRDHGAILSQSKSVMAKYKYKNQTVGKIVKQIAEDFGLTADVDDPGTLAGAEQHGQHTYLPNADNPWSLIQNLARQTGCHARVTADKVLEFKKSDEEDGQITVHYFGDAKSEIKNRLRDDFETDYQVCKNGDVKVKVISIRPDKVEKIVAEATAKGEEPSSKGKSKSSVVAGNKKKPGRKPRSHIKASETPTIVVRRPGLTQEKADELAKAMAKDVAKRQIIQTGSIEYTKELKLRGKLKIETGQGMDLIGFEHIEYQISEASCSFSFSEGLLSKFKALLRPEVE